MKQFYFILLAVFALNFTQTNAQIVNIPDSEFKDALVYDNVAKLTMDGPYVDADTNNDGEIQVSEAEAIVVLQLYSKNINHLQGVEAFSNLVQLYCHINNLTDLDLTQNTSLTYLNCSQNDLTDLQLPSSLNSLHAGSNDLITLDVSQNATMTFLNCSNNQLTTLLNTSSTDLYEIRCQNNFLTSVDVSGNSGLRTFECYNNVITDILGLEDAVSLESLICTGNPLNGLNVDANINLIELQCINNGLTNLNLTNNVALESLYCYTNQLISLDLSQNVVLDYFNASGNQLINVFMKNDYRTTSGNFNLFGNPNLSYICADDSEISTMAIYVNSAGYNCAVDSDCTSGENGVFHLLEGTARVDTDLNDCSGSDPIYGGLQLQISDGSDESIYFTNSSGNYSISIQLQEYTITPVLENFDYFSATPSPIMVNFNSEAYPYNQDFCIVPAGDYDDLEVINVPFMNAVPGFDTDYEIVFYNKGTTSLSGDVILTFDDNVMDFDSAMPNESSINTGQITWNYMDLAPFESRSIRYTMTLNTPTDPNFPLSSDDVLDFNVIVNPSTTDETPDDNAFVLSQTVVNSYDPNDKRCLEGDVIALDEVGEYVHYVIRFENNGTANAQKVVITDEIDLAKFDISTLKPLSASHEFIARINETNKVDFIFDNIDLPFDDANNDGYVAFKIKTLPSLGLGDTFSNQADIFFDFNAPIATNIAETTVFNTLSTQDYVVDSNIEFYPNPVKDILNITSQNPIKSISIHDINGRALNDLKLLGNKTKTEINLNKLSKGIYFVKVTSELGYIVERVVKK